MPLLSLLTQGSRGNTRYLEMPAHFAKLLFQVITVQWYINVMLKLNAKQLLHLHFKMFRSEIQLLKIIMM